ncbi:serine hydrolase domain-containing protein [Planobispora takensis]|uniref:Serine hydrolase n=1 Tax=Planobispora takensis TaxID=1367882 RepID=A0A8J3T4K1_9ACTN|nr:serine hydrolase domain-containing protein [Planobispora takensis]GII05593.1 serine hydrolase [Planobispora takensis]
MTAWTSEIDELARTGDFSGVVLVEREGKTELAAAYGLACRAHEVPNTVDTRFAIASGTKGLTALTVMSLVEEGALTLSTTARSVLGGDLPLIDDAVTVEHLLEHRSGIGDYFDENEAYDITDHVLTVPAHTLVTTEDYLPALAGRTAKFPPGEEFSYCNSGYVVLALIAGRVSGVAFHDLVRQRVCEPAGMADTAFLRSDELPGRTATGYLPVEGVSRSNVFHLPIRGSGDGGLYSTAADIGGMWRALFDGRIVSPATVAGMIRPRSDVPSESMRYGRGFWLHASRETVMLEGYDAGVSFRSVHDPGLGLTHTVISNTSTGAWPVTRRLDAVLGLDSAATAP